MFGQRTIMGQDGESKNLWVQYEDGFFEPVRKDGDVRNKGRGDRKSVV